MTYKMQAKSHKLGNWIETLNTVLTYVKLILTTKYSTELTIQQTSGLILHV